MPVVGLNKKAKPRHVYNAYAEADAHPKPSPTETFKAFEARLEGDGDYVMRVLVALGYGEPSRREYLFRLSELREVLNQVNAKLYETWKKDKGA